MGNIQVINADILRWAASYDGPLFHAALLDAPYEMEFMGKGWDNTGVAFDPETWKAIARCLHPGAFLFVFAGTINDDLISVAMRQAGLRKYHRAMAWGYGSGFPKATDLPAQIDEDAFQRWLATHEKERAIITRYRDAVQIARRAHKSDPMAVPRSAINEAHAAYRAKRQAIKAAAGFLKTKGTKKHQPKFAAAELGYREKDNGYNSKERETFEVSTPATPMAQTWDGYAYGGQAIKPAVESILIFQKPYAGSPVSSITATGAGAINVDGGRIGTSENDPNLRFNPVNHIGGGYQSLPADNTDHGPAAGRWPANLILSHSPRCNGDCAPDCAVRRLGEQSGETTAGHRPGGGTGGIWSDEVNICISPEHGDTGTAARFFFNADFMAERLEEADAVIYAAKSSRAEREAGLDPRQVRLMEMGEIEDSGQDHSAYGEFKGIPGTKHTPNQRRDFDLDTINDGRQKPIDNPYQRGQTTRRNIHPTIKPISLARHLATLLLPPAEYAPRRLLVPFSGAGSEMIGALLAGWDEIVGVELEADHCRIAEARLAYWQQRRHEFLDPSKPITAALADAPDGQLELF